MHGTYHDAVHCCVVPGIIKHFQNAKAHDDVVVELDNGETWLSALKRHLCFTDWMFATLIPTPTDERDIEVSECWVCTKCGADHEDENAAEDCCPQVDCPVCNEAHYTFRDAADCCLWHDIDAITRWAIADRVEEGADWRDALHESHG